MRLLALLAGAVLPLVLWGAFPLFSQGAGAGDRAGALRSELNAKERRLAGKRRTEALLTTDVTAYSRRIASLQGRVSALSTRLGRAQRDLDAQQARLETSQSRLRGERARLVRLRLRLALTRRMLARRLVDLYQADRPDLVTVVLNSNGFSELLERGEFLMRVADNDRRLVGTVRRARDDAASSAIRLTRLVSQLQREVDIVRARRQEIAVAHQRLVDVRAGLEESREAKRNAVAAVRVSRRRLESEVIGLRAQQAKVQRALQRTQPRNTGGGPPLTEPGPVRQGSGSFIWPVDGPITSPFCERRSWESCHPGLDIAAPEGTPIRAFAPGRVVLLQGVAASGGYGNYTCVQHAGTLSSCYAHQSRFGTTTGATVEQGQVIGYVGNTGRSFGAHLHFEVRINGTVANPLNYL